ncbi:hypothetical protein LEMLEM_LOCUS12643 [Lemmus lemmus]
MASVVILHEDRSHQIRPWSGCGGGCGEDSAQEAPRGLHFRFVQAFHGALRPFSRAHRRTECESTQRPASAWAEGGRDRGGAGRVTRGPSQWGARPRPSLLRAFAAPAASRERPESAESGERRAPSSAAGSAGCGQERWTRGRVRSRAARARSRQATPSPGGRRAGFRGRVGPSGRSRAVPWRALFELRAGALGMREPLV